MTYSLDDWRNIAVIAGVIIALLVYITNSYHQYKQRISDNALRYIEVHEKLFANKFLADNIQAMEAGTFKRDATNQESEKAFNRLLGEIEHLALLANHGVISKESQGITRNQWGQIELIKGIKESMGSRNQ